MNNTSASEEAVMPQPVLREHVQDAVDHAYIWSHQTDASGIHSYLPIAEQTMSDETEPAWTNLVPTNGFSRSHMSLVDSRLADALDAEIAENQRVKQSPSSRNWLLTGSCLRYSLQFWRNALLALPKEAFSDNSLIVDDQYIAGEGLRLRLEVDIDGSELLSMWHENCSFKPLGKTVYCSYYRRIDETLSTSWMDQHYPAWRTALHLADTLDATGDILVQLVFQVGVAMADQNTRGIEGIELG